ncbi:MAG: hypothetical protein RBU30_25910 [Polyangia bacterium]|jgi:hypothetical protein|nr:hypothetical protein [Polyangia bacterium]
MAADRVAASRGVVEAGARDVPPPPRGKKPPELEVRWDPRTGRGDVLHRFPTGDRMRTCFHCRYPGYTGGLVIGNFDGSGLGFYPRRALRGFSRINVFCAQDESFWDLDEKAEYTYGWSENYGKGPDGKRLEFVRGRVLEAGPERVVLQSENAGGCYRVTKVATTRAGAPWWILATRVTNRCARPLRFHLFSGDDPWIGTYKSSEGDVGWTPDGLVRHERALGAGQFTVGGMYDLGNEASGERQGAFSNQANFVRLDPAAPLPDVAFFANSFAHKAADIDQRRVLDHKTLTALNLGWTDRRLEKGEGLTIAFALGLAETGTPGGVPRAPEPSDEDWSLWRRHLKEGNLASGAQAAQFAAERVELELDRGALRVSGAYVLRSRSDASSSLSITYPVLTGPDRPAPGHIEVDGQQLPLVAAAPGRAEARFPVRLPPRGIARFRVRYRQEHRGRFAAYMVTSALSWPAPIGQAVFVVRHPAALGRVRVSYAPTRTERKDGVVTHWLVMRDFVPNRELELRW